MYVTSATPSCPGRPDRPAVPSRRHATLCLAAALLLPQLPACASATRVRAQPAAISIIDRDSGQPLTVYRKDGRSYVAGRPGSRYAIRLSNRTASRVLVVLSVDGVNVISGETAGVGQGGYVLDPWRSFDITGWRKSDTAVAAFEFAALSDSYAAKTGRPGNVGVIGMAVFLEKPAREPAPPIAEGRSERANGFRARQDSSAKAAAPPSPSAPAAASAESQAADAARPAPMARRTEIERLGTAHGQREWSVSRRTTFERLGSAPQDVVEIAYDSYANLVIAGVIPRPATQARAFPNDDSRGFVPDPPLR